MKYLDFSKLFHRMTKGSSEIEAVPVKDFDTAWPEEWKTIFYKTYERLPRIILPSNVEQSPLFDLIANRISRRRFSGEVLSLGVLADILKYSCGETQKLQNGHYHRAQPSGGARFPIETYVLIFKGSKELPSGVYHYDVHNHALHILWERTFIKEDLQSYFSYEWAVGATAAILLTGVFNRTKMKYGERGYRFTLLEAGHIGQNIYLTSQSLGIGCCAIAGTRDKALEELLQIDGENEAVVYSLILGK